MQHNSCCRAVQDHAATKHGDLGITKLVANDSTSFTVRVNAIGPCAHLSEMTADWRKDRENLSAWVHRHDPHGPPWAAGRADDVVVRAQLRAARTHRGPSDPPRQCRVELHDRQCVFSDDRSLPMSTRRHESGQRSPHEA